MTAATEAQARRQAIKARSAAQARAADEARRLSGLIEAGLSWDYPGRFALPAVEKLLANAEALADRIRERHRRAVEATK